MIPTMFWYTCYLAKINLFSLLPCVLRKSAAQQHCSHVHILSTGTFKQEGFNNLCFKICSHTLAGQQAHLQKCKSGLAGGDNKAKLVKHTHTKKTLMEQVTKDCSRNCDASSRRASPVVTCFISVFFFFLTYKFHQANCRQMMIAYVLSPIYSSHFPNLIKIITNI